MSGQQVPGQGNVPPYQLPMSFPPPFQPQSNVVGQTVQYEIVNPVYASIPTRTPTPPQPLCGITGQPFYNQGVPVQFNSGVSNLSPYSSQGKIPMPSAHYPMIATQQSTLYPSHLSSQDLPGFPLQQMSNPATPNLTHQTCTPATQQTPLAIRNLTQQTSQPLSMFPAHSSNPVTPCLSPAFGKSCPTSNATSQSSLADLRSVPSPAAFPMSAGLTPVCAIPTPPTQAVSPLSVFTSLSTISHPCPPSTGAPVSSLVNMSSKPESCITSMSSKPEIGLAGFKSSPSLPTQSSTPVSGYYKPDVKSVSGIPNTSQSDQSFVFDPLKLMCQSVDLKAAPGPSGQIKTSRPDFVIDPQAPLSRPACSGDALQRMDTSYSASQPRSASSSATAEKKMENKTFATELSPVDGPKRPLSSGWPRVSSSGCIIALDPSASEFKPVANIQGDDPVTDTPPLEGSKCPVKSGRPRERSLDSIISLDPSASEFKPKSTSYLHFSSPQLDSSSDVFLDSSPEKSRLQNSCSSSPKTNTVNDSSSKSESLISNINVSNFSLYSTDTSSNVEAFDSSINSLKTSSNVSSLFSSSPSYAKSNLSVDDMLCSDPLAVSDVMVPEKSDSSQPSSNVARSVGGRTTTGWSTWKSPPVETHNTSQKKRGGQESNLDTPSRRETVAVSHKEDMRHKSSQTERPEQREKRKDADIAVTNLKVRNLQAEVCQLRAQLCLNELQRLQFQLEMDLFSLKSNFRPVIPSHANKTMTDLQSKLQNIMLQIKEVQVQRDHCLFVLKSGIELKELPSFDIQLSTGEIIAPAQGGGSLFELPSISLQPSPSKVPTRTDSPNMADEEGNKRKKQRLQCERQAKEALSSPDEEHVKRTSLSKDEEPVERMPLSKDEELVERTPLSKDKEYVKRTPFSKDEEQTKEAPSSQEKEHMKRTPLSKDEELVERPPLSKDEEPMERTPLSKDEESMERMPLSKDEEPVERTPLSKDEEPVERTPLSKDEEPVERTPLAKDEEPVERMPLSKDEEDSVGEHDFTAVPQPSGFSSDNTSVNSSVKGDGVSPERLTVAVSEEQDVLSQFGPESSHLEDSLQAEQQGEGETSIADAKCKFKSVIKELSKRVSASEQDVDKESGSGEIEKNSAADNHCRDEPSELSQENSSSQDNLKEQEMESAQTNEEMSATEKASFGDDETPEEFSAGRSPPAESECPDQKKMLKDLDKDPVSKHFNEMSASESSLNEPTSEKNESMAEKSKEPTLIGLKTSSDNVKESGFETPKSVTENSEEPVLKTLDKHPTDEDPCHHKKTSSGSTACPDNSQSPASTTSAKSKQQEGYDLQQETFTDFEKGDGQKADIEEKKGGDVSDLSDKSFDTFHDAVESVSELDVINETQTSSASDTSHETTTEQHADVKSACDPVKENEEEITITKDQITTDVTSSVADGQQYEYQSSTDAITPEKSPSDNDVVNETSPGDDEIKERSLPDVPTEEKTPSGDVIRETSPSDKDVINETSPGDDEIKERILPDVFSEETTSSSQQPGASTQTKGTAEGVSADTNRSGTQHEEKEKEIPKAEETANGVLGTSEVRIVEERRPTDSRTPPKKTDLFGVESDSDDESSMIERLKRQSTSSVDSADSRCKVKLQETKQTGIGLQELENKALGTKQTESQGTKPQKTEPQHAKPQEVERQDVQSELRNAIIKEASLLSPSGPAKAASTASSSTCDSSNTNINGPSAAATSDTTPSAPPCAMAGDATASIAAGEKAKVEPASGPAPKANTSTGAETRGHQVRETQRPSDRSAEASRLDGGDDGEVTVDPDQMLQSVTERLKKLYPSQAQDEHWLQITAKEQTKILLEVAAERSNRCDETSTKGQNPPPPRQDLPLPQQQPEPTHFSHLTGRPAPPAAPPQTQPHAFGEPPQSAGPKPEQVHHGPSRERASPQEKPGLFHINGGQTEDLRTRREAVLRQHQEAMMRQNQALARAAAVQKVLLTHNTCMNTAASPALSVQFEATLKQYQALLDEAERFGRESAGLDQQQKLLHTMLHGRSTGSGPSGRPSGFGATGTVPSAAAGYFSPSSGFGAADAFGSMLNQDVPGSRSSQQEGLGSRSAFSSIQASYPHFFSYKPESAQASIVTTTPSAPPPAPPRPPVAQNRPPLRVPPLSNVATRTFVKRTSTVLGDLNQRTMFRSVDPAIVSSSLAAGQAGPALDQPVNTSACGVSPMSLSFQPDVNAVSSGGGLQGRAPVHLPSAPAPLLSPSELFPTPGLAASQLPPSRSVHPPDPPQCSGPVAGASIPSDAKCGPSQPLSAKAAPGSSFLSISICDPPFLPSSKAAQPSPSGPDSGQSLPAGLAAEAPKVRRNAANMSAPPGIFGNPFLEDEAFNAAEFGKLSTSKLNATGKMSDVDSTMFTFTASQVSTSVNGKKAPLRKPRAHSAFMTMNMSANPATTGIASIDCLAAAVSPANEASHTKPSLSMQTRVSAALKQLRLVNSSVPLPSVSTSAQLFPAGSGSTSAKPVTPVNTSLTPLMSVNTSSKSVTPVNTSSKPVTPVNRTSKPVTAMNTSLTPLMSVNTSSKSVTSVNTSSKPVTPVNRTSKPVTPVNTSAKSVTAAKTSSKPIPSVNTSSKPVTPVNASAKPVSTVNISTKPVTPVNTSSKPFTAVNTSSKPFTALNTSSKPATSVDTSANLSTPVISPKIDSSSSNASSSMQTSQNDALKHYRAVKLKSCSTPTGSAASVLAAVTPPRPTQTPGSAQSSPEAFKVRLPMKPIKMSSNPFAALESDWEESQEKDRSSLATATQDNRDKQVRGKKKVSAEDFPEELLVVSKRQKEGEGAGPEDTDSEGGGDWQVKSSKKKKKTKRGGKTRRERRRQQQGAQVEVQGSTPPHPSQPAPPARPLAETMNSSVSSRASRSSSSSSECRSMRSGSECRSTRSGSECRSTRSSSVSRVTSPDLTPPPASFSSVSSRPPVAKTAGSQKVEAKQEQPGGRVAGPHLRQWNPVPAGASSLLLSKAQASQDPFPSLLSVARAQPTNPNPSDQDQRSSALRLDQFSFSKKLAKGSVSVAEKPLPRSRPNVNTSFLGQMVCDNVKANHKRESAPSVRPKVRPCVEGEQLEGYGAEGGGKKESAVTEDKHKVEDQRQTGDAAREDATETASGASQPQKLTAYSKLFMIISVSFPNLPESVIASAIKAVKESYGGHFQGRRFSDIVGDAKKVILRDFTDKLRSPKQALPVFTKMVTQEKEKASDGEKPKQERGSWQQPGPTAGASFKAKEVECSICLTEFSRGSHYPLDCGHIFHKECIDMWVKDQGERTCPICRNIVLMTDDFPRLGQGARPVRSSSRSRQAMTRHDVDFPKLGS